MFYGEAVKQQGIPFPFDSSQSPVSCCYNPCQDISYFITRQRACENRKRVFSATDLADKTQEHFMRRALQLARRGAGRTSPNPMVGAVVVKKGRVIGEGAHKKAGSPHAEIEALKQAGPNAKGAQLVVNLEPCCHFGKTPPCTEAIVAAGIREVIVGMRDPNPLVAGKGMRRLKAKGIAVVSGVLKKECETLNEVFGKYIRTGRPFVILKTAISLDGKIATASGQSKWITGAKARGKVHGIRNEVDAILAGAGTIVHDDPLLTTRLKRQSAVRHPARVILDNEFLVPLSAKVFKNADRERVLYATGKNLPNSRRRKLAALGVETLLLKEKGGGVDLKQLMQALGERELTSVLIEGGAEVNASALKAGLVDKVQVFVAPMLIGGRGAPGPVGGEGIQRLTDALKIKRLKVSPIGDDWLLEGYL